MKVELVDNINSLIPMLNKYATSDKFQVIVDIIENMLESPINTLTFNILDKKFVLPPSNFSNEKQFGYLFFSKNPKLNVFSNLFMNPLFEDDNKLRLINKFIKNESTPKTILAKII